MKNILYNQNGLSGIRGIQRTVPEGNLLRHEAGLNPASGQGDGVLYGMQSFWPAGAVPFLDSLGTVEANALIAAALVFCLLLLWNTNLRNRFARYRRHASVQSERYRHFFDNCPDALLVVEHDGSIVSANAHASGMLKVDGQDFLAQTFWTYVDGASRPEFTKQFKLCMSGKRMRFEGDFLASDGTIVPVEVSGSLQHIDGKRLMLLYIRNVSDLREIEEQVRSLYNQLEKAAVDAEEKGRRVEEEAHLARQEFIAFANHRIRTPLDGISGMAQLLADTPLDIDQRNCVYAILNSSSSLLSVIRNLAEETEDDPGQTEFREEFVDLHEVCKTLHRKHEPTAIRKGLDFRCDCQSNVPVNVVTDGRLLNRVLSGLLENAIAFTGQGLVVLNIECRRESADHAELYFHVIDTGVGIDQELQPVVFEKSDAAKRNAYAHYDRKGSDLGTCRELVERLGGTIGLNSTKDRGSTFYFSLTLPLALSEPTVEVAAPSQSVRLPGAGISSDAAVLVVEDNRISQKVVVAMLRKAGCSVDAVGNGKEALSQIQKKHYDVILMDCQMPVMDGYEATTRIRSMPGPVGSTPVIALTAHSLKHELQACRECGMDDHLVKPADRQLLIETVQKYARTSRKETVPALKAAS